MNTLYQVRQEGGIPHHEARVGAESALVEAYVIELRRGSRERTDIAWTRRGPDEARRLAALANPGWEPIEVRQVRRSLR